MTDGTTIAANLARLRLDRGLTQEDLALKSGLSRLALGRIERGDAVPRASTVRVLAKALNVPVGELIVPVRPLESVRFRAKAKVRSREQVLAVVSKWLEAYAWLEEELGERAAFRFGKARHGSDQAEPAAMAQAARKAVGLAPEAPVRDICGLLNQGGVKLLLLETNRDSFFGLSVGQADGGPAVVVNTWERISVERWIFTAAQRRTVRRCATHHGRAHGGLPQHGSGDATERSSRRMARQTIEGASRRRDARIVGAAVRRRRPSHDDGFREGNGRIRQVQPRQASSPRGDR